MNRRSFLMTPALGAAARVQPAAAQQPGEIKLGVASYSLRKKTLAETLAALKALNVRYLKMKCEVHLPLASSPAQIAEAKRMIEDAGIVLESTGNNPMDKESLVRSKFEFNKQLGVKLMIIAPSMATLPLVEKCVKEYDIRVALHNHGPEDPNFPTPSSVLKALKGADPRMGLCLDIGHTARAGEDFLKSIRDAGPRLLDIDAKDLGRTGKKWTECEVGEGALPIAPMFKVLKAQRWAGIAHLEYEINADNPLPGMRQAFAYMRGVQAGLRA
jgi:sugar phosphate isomerase/epimerase